MSLNPYLDNTPNVTVKDTNFSNIMSHYKSQTVFADVKLFGYTDRWY